MPDCRYCDASFETEDAYLTHLQDAHADELSPIDKRRVAAGDRADGGLGISTGPLVIGAIVLTVGVLVAYVSFFSGGNTDGQSGELTPHSVGTVHSHGTIEVIIMGTPIDFSQPQYQYHQTRTDAFHFEGGDGTQWHLHAQGVTLQWAMASLGIDITATTVTIDDTTYRDGDDTSVIIAVNGQSVEPSEYVLGEGDHIRIVVE